MLPIDRFLTILRNMEAKQFENMKNEKTLEPGSYSHATMRTRHLLPVFMAALESVDMDGANKLREEYAAVFEMLNAGDEPERLEDSQWLMEALFDKLDAHCPENHYFGAHPGDGSDFGVWECEMD